MKRFIYLIIISVIFSLSTFSQADSSDIYGTVVLPNGNPLQGVLVTLTGDMIGKIIAVTSKEGNFRFLKLPPGNYKLKFQLIGFKDLVRKGIRLFLGKNLNLTFQMDVATIKNELAIKAGTGIIDTKKATIGVNIPKEAIQSLPTSRNPWTLVNLIPGIMIDREDVGGNESGQQSNFYGHGSSMNNTTWTVDGANITDPSADGSSSFYMNVNSHEELQITLGANDILTQTGGVQLNFVTKRAGNHLSGEFHLYAEDESWEMNQKLPISISEKNLVSPGIIRLYQYGFNLGGPILKDKTWFFGSWAVQDIHSRTIAGNDDSTWLTSGYGKLSFHFGKTFIEFFLHHDNKIKSGRTSLGAANQDFNSLWEQSGQGYLYSGSFQQVIGNFMLNAKIIYNENGFTLDPRGSDPDEEGHNSGNDWLYYYSPSRYDAGSKEHYITDRDSLNFSVDGNYFKENIFGGDHEIRFGVDYYSADTTSTILYPNQRIAMIQIKDDPQYYQELWLIPDSKYDMNFRRISFYLSDTATFGKLCVNLGIRYDREKGKLNGCTQRAFSWYEPGSLFHGSCPPEVNSYLREITVPDLDVPIGWTTLSPRLSAAYNLTGNGKNVLKLAVARYGSRSGNYLASNLFPEREINVRWYDTNYDLVPNYYEVDFSDWTYWNVDNIDYDLGVSRNQYDQYFSSPLLDEGIVTFEKELKEDLGISITLFFKKRHNLIAERGIMSDGSVETKENWYLLGDFSHPNSTVVPLYGRYEKPVGTYFTNLDKGYDRYLAFQLVVTKKLSDKWMMDGSFIYMDWRKFRFEDETLDLNNFNYFNGGVVAPVSSGSGLSGIYGNSRWQFKLSGLHKLHFGFNFSYVFLAREGYVIPYYSWVYISEGDVGWTKMYESGKKFGDDRLPVFWILNLAVEKDFKISDNIRATVFINAYNLTNNSTTLKVNPVLGDSQDEIEHILNSGIFQFGLRITF